MTDPGPGPSNTVLALYVVLMIAVIIALDFTLFRHHFLQRLIVNIVVVLVFAAVYFLVLKRT